MTTVGSMQPQQALLMGCWLSSDGGRWVVGFGMMIGAGEGANGQSSLCSWGKGNLCYARSWLAAGSLEHFRLAIVATVGFC